MLLAFLNADDRILASASSSSSLFYSCRVGVTGFSSPHNSIISQLSHHSLFDYFTYHAIDSSLSRSSSTSVPPLITNVLLITIHPYDMKKKLIKTPLLVFFYFYEGRYYRFKHYCQLVHKTIQLLCISLHVTSL